MPRELSASPPCERVSFPHPSVVISNARLIALDAAGVTFKWKDYRIEGRDWLKTMTLDGDEFIRRFLLRRGLLPCFRSVGSAGGSSRPRAGRSPLGAIADTAFQVLAKYIRRDV
jgi:Putative transposase